MGVSGIQTHTIWSDCDFTHTFTLQWRHAWEPGNRETHETHSRHRDTQLITGQDHTNTTHDHQLMFKRVLLCPNKRRNSTTVYRI